MKIYKQKHGRGNESTLVDLAARLVELGYQVAIRKEKPEGKTTWVTYIEVVGDLPEKERLT